MTPGGLITLLELTADECREADVPADPFDRDAVLIAATKASREIQLLAQRVATTNRRARWERTWARRYRKGR